MENKTVPLTGNQESMDNRAEWIAPAIMDYDIEEATCGPTANITHTADFGGLTYS